MKKSKLIKVLTSASLIVSLICAPIISCSSSNNQNKKNNNSANKVNTKPTKTNNQPLKTPNKVTSSHPSPIIPTPMPKPSSSSHPLQITPKKLNDAFIMSNQKGAYVLLKSGTLELVINNLPVHSTVEWYQIEKKQYFYKGDVLSLQGKNVGATTYFAVIITPTGQVIKTSDYVVDVVKKPQWTNSSITTSNVTTLSKNVHYYNNETYSFSLNYSLKNWTVIISYNNQVLKPTNQIYSFVPNLSAKTFQITYVSSIDPNVTKTFYQIINVIKAPQWTDTAISNNNVTNLSSKTIYYANNKLTFKVHTAPNNWKIASVQYGSQTLKVNTDGQYKLTCNIKNKTISVNYVNLQDSNSIKTFRQILNIQQNPSPKFNEFIIVGLPSKNTTVYANEKCSLDITSNDWKINSLFLNNRSIKLVNNKYTFVWSNGLNIITLNLTSLKDENYTVTQFKLLQIQASPQLPSPSASKFTFGTPLPKSTIYVGSKYKTTIKAPNDWIISDVEFNGSKVSATSGIYSFTWINGTNTIKAIIVSTLDTSDSQTVTLYSAIAVAPTTTANALNAQWSKNLAYGVACSVTLSNPIGWTIQSVSYDGLSLKNINKTWSFTPISGINIIKVVVSYNNNPTYIQTINLHLPKFNDIANSNSNSEQELGFQPAAPEININWPTDVFANKKVQFTLPTTLLENWNIESVTYDFSPIDQIDGVYAFVPNTSFDYIFVSIINKQVPSTKYTIRCGFNLINIQTPTIIINWPHEIYPNSKVTFNLPSWLPEYWNINGVYYNNKLLTPMSDGSYSFQIVNSINNISFSITNKQYPTFTVNHLLSNSFNIISYTNNDYPVDALQLAWVTDPVFGQSATFKLILPIGWTLSDPTITYGNQQLTPNTKGEYTFVPQENGNSITAYLKNISCPSINHIAATITQQEFNIFDMINGYGGDGYNNGSTFYMNWPNAVFDNSSLQFNLPTAITSIFNTVNGTPGATRVSGFTYKMNINKNSTSYTLSVGDAQGASVYATSNSLNVISLPNITWSNTIYPDTPYTFTIPQSITNNWIVQSLEYDGNEILQNPDGSFTIIPNSNANNVQITLAYKLNPNFIDTVSSNNFNLQNPLPAPTLNINWNQNITSSSVVQFSLPNNFLSQYNIISVWYANEELLSRNNSYTFNVQNGYNNVALIVQLKKYPSTIFHIWSNHFNFLSNNSNQSFSAYFKAQSTTQVFPIGSTLILSNKSDSNKNHYYSQITFSVNHSNNDYYINTTCNLNSIMQYQSSIMGFGIYTPKGSLINFKTLNISDLQTQWLGLNNLQIPLNTVFMFYFVPSFFNCEAKWNNTNIETNQYLYYQLTTNGLVLINNITTAKAICTSQNNNSIVLNVSGMTLPNASVNVSYGDFHQTVTANAKGVYDLTFSTAYLELQNLIVAPVKTNVPIYCALNTPYKINESVIALSGKYGVDGGVIPNGMIGFNPFNMHLTFNDYTNQALYPTFSKPNNAIWSLSYSQNNLNTYFFNQNGLSGFLFSFQLLNAKDQSLAKFNVTTNTTKLAFYNFINNLTFQFGDHIKMQVMTELNLNNKSIYNLSNPYTQFVIGANDFNQLVFHPVMTTSNSKLNSGQSTYSGPIYYEATISPNGLINTSSDYVTGNGDKVSMGNSPSLNLSPSNYLSGAGYKTTDSYCPSYVTDLNYSSWYLAFNSNNTVKDKSYNPAYDLQITSSVFYATVKKLMGQYTFQDIQTSVKADNWVANNILNWVLYDKVYPDENASLQYTCNDMFNYKGRCGAVCQEYSLLYADVLSAAGFVVTMCDGYNNWSEIPTIYNSGLYDHEFVCVYLPAEHYWQMTNPAFYTYNASFILGCYYNIVASATLWNPSHPFNYYFQDNNNEASSFDPHSEFYLQGVALNQYYNYIETDNSNLEKIYKYITSIN